MEEDENHYDPERFVTKTYQSITQAQMQAKEDQETKAEYKRILLEKKESYAKYVRESHLPPKSTRKVKELQLKIDHLKHPIRESVKYKPDSYRGLKEVTTRSHSRSGVVLDKLQ
jgi:hypothetical protein